MTTLLRAVAVAIALASIVDPALEVTRARPGVVEVHAGQGVTGDPRAIEAAVRDRLAGALAVPARAAAAEPAAVVVIDPSRRDLERHAAHGDGVPLSFVETRPLAAPGVRIISVEQPRPVLPGQTAVVRVHLQVSGRVDAGVVVSLEHDGVPLSRAAAVASGDAAGLTVDLSHAPPAAGIHRLRVVARFADDEDGESEYADVAVVAEARRLRVLVFEPRPSWAVTFVRHALEADPIFEPAVLARASRDINVRSGDAPARLTAATLERFDAVLVGAPNGLSATDVHAIETFARERGGAVVLVPDRRPSGPYARLLPPSIFDEALLESPAALLAGGLSLRASELALPRELSPGVTTLASVEQRGGRRPVVMSWPLGDGRLVFSGALDAWRYRGDAGGGFARFWTGLAANLAAAAPRPLEISVEPAVSAPGDRLRVQARVRRTGFVMHGARIEVPAVTAAMVAGDGARTFVRLWPAAEPGLFEGIVEAPGQGRHLVQVASGPWTADAPILVAEGVRQARDVDAALLDRAARATGGTLVDASTLDPLAAHLRQLQAPAPEDVHPMRSGWWLLAFAGSLAGEWALRRRRGLR